MFSKLKGRTCSEAGARISTLEAQPVSMMQRMSRFIVFNVSGAAGLMSSGQSSLKTPSEGNSDTLLPSLTLSAPLFRKFALKDLE